MELEKLRKQIDLVDHEIIHKLAKRKELLEQIGKIKKEKGVNPLDLARWEKVRVDRKLYAKKLGIPENLIGEMWEIIHQWSLIVEKKA